jgi:hypothetical protein
MPSFFHNGEVGRAKIWKILPLSNLDGRVGGCSWSESFLTFSFLLCGNQILNNPRHRERLLESFNKSTLDDGAAPIGDGEMTILRDMESLDQEHEQYMDSLRASRLGISEPNE